MELFTLGIDLGKTTFHVVGMNQRGEIVVRKRFTRTQLLHFTANLKVELIGMEACGGSHFLGRALREQGHEVRLIPAQYVKPYVKTNKNDYIDAEAIAEAVGRPRMRFVPVESDEQLDLQSLHRVRERWVMRRTAAVNQVRGLLLERGITLPKGRRYVDAALPGILADPATKLATQRTSVTAIARALQERGSISYSRGTIVILNRGGLEKAACDCYAITKKLYVGLYGRNLSNKG
jgi:transposase